MVRVALSHDWGFMPQQPLHLVQFHTRLHQPRGRRIPEIAEVKILDLALAERSVAQEQLSTIVNREISRDASVSERH